MSQKVYSYSRVSSAPQIDGTGIERQGQGAEAYAAGLKMPLDSTFCDLGKSGFKAENLKEGGALAAFLALVEAGQITRGSHLYVEAVDRLSRMPFDSAYALLSRIIKADITIYTAQDGQIYSKSNYNDLGVIIPLAVKISMAHEYSKNLSDKIGKTKQINLQTARDTGKPVTKNCPRWLRVSDDEKGFEIIPPRAAVVRQIFEWASNGEGSPSIASKLNKNKIPVFDVEEMGIKTGKKKYTPLWREHYVATIVRGRAVLGEYQPCLERHSTQGKRVKNGNPLPNYYPPIIDIALWNAAQVARTANRHTGNQKQDRVSNILTGKMFCSFCGEKIFFVGREEGREKYTYLHCHVSRRKAGCEAKGCFSYHKLETAVLKRLSLMDAEKVFHHSAPKASVQLLRDEATRLTVARDAGEAALASWIGGVKSDRIARIVATKEAELDDIEARLKAVEKQLEEASTASMGEQASLVGRLAAAAQAGNVEARQQVRTALRSLITRIDVNVVQKWCEVYCANDFIFNVYNNGQTVDIETGGPRESMGRTFTINKFSEHPA